MIPKNKSFWVIEWIRHTTEAGYVSYGRIAFIGIQKGMPLQEHDEYMPVPLPYATKTLPKSNICKTIWVSA
jgi:hypothetical protein